MERAIASMAHTVTFQPIVFVTVLPMALSSNELRSSVNQNINLTAGNARVMYIPREE